MNIAKQAGRTGRFGLLKKEDYIWFMVLQVVLTLVDLIQRGRTSTSEKGPHTLEKSLQLMK
jgi:hypothetical protein